MYFHMPASIVMLTNPQGRQIVGYARNPPTRVQYMANAILSRADDQPVYHSTKSRIAPTNRIAVNPIVEVFTELVPELPDHFLSGTHLQMADSVWQVLRNVVGLEFMQERIDRVGVPLKLLYPY
ncbi:MAG: hypothetical protein EOP83_25955 [Verrucomicrobiaceae bacterium]|nr:MAG: hypothetical protein EOP83_25955 [Verrucomicrobiaceae bacterium]